MVLPLLLMLSVGQIKVRDEGVPQGTGWVDVVNCSGSGITCTVTGRTATFDVVAGSGGGVPATIPAVTYSATADLSAERVLSTGNYTTIDLGTAAQAQVDWAHGLTCTSGQALTSSGTTAMACTSTLTASDLVCAGTCVADAEIAGVSGSKVSGAVPTATALAADPAACGAGAYVSDISAAGVLTCSAPPGTYALPDSTSLVTGGVRLAGDLAGTATSPSVVDDSHAHTASTISALDTSDVTTGVFVAARGALGIAQPTCTAGQFLTCNGTTCSCGTPSGGGGSANVVEVDINFGAGADSASVVVTGQAWVTTSSKILCVPTMLATSTRDEGAEDAVAEGLIGAVHSRVNATGFTLFASPRLGVAVGIYKFHCTGS